jgi:uncharacterized membrane protein
MKRWIYVINSLFALWLISAPATMGYDSKALMISDLVSGFLILVASIIAINFKKDSMKWFIGMIGLWLTFAPILFWAPDAASYANDTIIGTLLMMTSLIVPSLVESAEPHDTGFPTGWSYNPSTWEQRTPIIILAFLGFLMARYLSAFQLGHTASAWDPFFGKGTEKILTSDVSKWFPVSDAGLGAWSYLIDAIFGAVGGVRRWRTMPWVVLLFGLMVVPPGVTSIILVILQPLAVGEWCSICLATAVVMLLMVPPAIDEVVATIQAMYVAKINNQRLWTIFWEGVPLEYSPALIEKRPYQFPWNLLICTCLGSWLMYSPEFFKATGIASDANHVLGALIVTTAIVATAEVGRPVRFANCFFGLILVLSIWFLPGSEINYKINATIIGSLLFIFSMPLGKISDRFGNYDYWVQWTPFHRQKN